MLNEILSRSFENHSLPSTLKRKITTRSFFNRNTSLFYISKILARPYFSYPLKSQHVDIGSKLTWRCEATAMPEPVYEWYKDGLLLAVIPGKISIVRNVLTIQNLEISDNGMYQCSAENIYGKSFTEGQLRVLGINLFSNL